MPYIKAEFRRSLDQRIAVLRAEIADALQESWRRLVIVTGLQDYRRDAMPSF
jgi:hypothetical protein